MALDIGYLEEVVSRLVEASVAPSTRKTYLSGQRRYFSFCKGVQLSYLPLTKDKACLFVAYLVDSKLKHATIKGYLSAVRDSVMLWAACCKCYFSFLRSGEVTVPSLKEYDGGAHLSEGDVSLDCVKSPKMVQVRIKQSKTDRFRKGVMVYLGRIGSELCPVAVVSAYLAVREGCQVRFFCI